MGQFFGHILFYADVRRGSSRVPAPSTSAEPKVKFLSHCSQISGDDHIKIIGDPIGAVEVKMLTSQTHTYKLSRVRYTTKDFCSGQEYNVGDKHWLFVYFSL